MEWIPGIEYHGFKLEQVTQIDEIKAVTYRMKHEKSGLKLFFIQNDDYNKVFMIGFRTPPPDSTGVPHILEHSVLNGSRKFPAKDPFMELAKGSLNSFLNAMTFSDKTFYPFASPNDKDFMNLMDVYMDAVLHPNFVQNPRILMQEGWHYHIENPEDPLKIQGVVYNEMKGAYSSPEAALFKHIYEVLFPDTCYGFDSGGDPDFIPDLTQENFIAFHKRYYHPSNGYAILYGNGDLSEYLAFLDSQYLQEYSVIEPDSDITRQKPFDKPLEMVFPYPVSAEESLEGKTYLSVNYMLDSANNLDMYHSLAILSYILVDSPAGVLKKALIDAGIGADVLALSDNSILQPVLGFVVKNTDESKLNAFLRVVQKTLTELVRGGIDKKLIEAAINHYEFSLREAEYGGFPKGLFYGLTFIMDSWLYGGDPEKYLTFNPFFQRIRKALKEPYFEQFIQRNILNNSHCAVVILKPDQKVAEQKEADLAHKLEELKKTLSEPQLGEMILKTKELIAYQQEEEPEEIKRKIPQLTLSDISKEAKALSMEERSVCGVKTLFHAVSTVQLAYLNFLFPLEVLPSELLPYAALLSEVLGQMDTSAHRYEELINEVNIHIGGLDYDSQLFAKFDDDKIYSPKFVVSTKYLTGNTTKTLGLIREILLSTRFDSKKRLKEILQESKSSFEMEMYFRGNMFAMMRLFSYFSPSGYLLEQWNGISYYQWICSNLRKFDVVSSEMLANLERTLHLLIRRSGLLVSLTCAEEDYSAFESKAFALLDTLPSEMVEKYVWEFCEGSVGSKGSGVSGSLKGSKREALLTQANVQYHAQGFNFRDVGGDYKGSWQVAQSILANDYLYKKIRVESGAYGANARITRNGMLAFTSYRDPKVGETLDVFKRAYNYLSQFTASEWEMTKYIIGTIAGIDHPLTPPQSGLRALNYYLTGMTVSLLQQERDQVLSATQGDIRSLAEIVRKCMEQNYYCILGNEKSLMENKELFTDLTQVMDCTRGT